MVANPYHLKCEFSDGSLFVNLSDDEQQRLSNLTERVSLKELGMILPHKIDSYYCVTCGTTHSDTPKVDIFIKKYASCGDVADILYNCDTCGEFVYGGTLFENLDKLDPDMITFDETGKYKKPTPESIEELLTGAEIIAKKGEGNLEHGHYEQNLKIVQRWSEEIDYEIEPKRIQNMKEIYQEEYLREAEENLPNIIKSIKNHAWQFNSGGDDLTECLDHLNEVLPHINVKPELIDDIIRIFFAEKNTYVEAAFDIKEKIEEMQKEADELNEMRQRWQQTIFSFAGKYNIGTDRLGEIENDPLDKSLPDANPEPDF